MINVLLCGGFGTRLWPLSRKERPKQFLNLIEKKSFFQKTALGNQDYCSDCIVVCHAEHHSLALNQLIECAIEPKSLILEEESRNTAAAICFALLLLDPKEIVLITPCDHLIDYSKEYSKALQEAEEFARKGFVAIFGIKPQCPETRFGYIESIGFHVKKFHEKPNKENAAAYMSMKNFYWNSGMLCARVDTLLEKIQGYATDIFEASKKAFINSSKIHSNTVKIHKEDMLTIPSASIDYALLEKTDQLIMIPANFKWNDIGDFKTLFSLLAKKKSNE